MADNDGLILVIQDTTEFSYNRKESGKIGWTKLFNSNNSLYKKCGILMHSSLAITSKGLPLGLCAIKFWSRKNFKGTKKELKTKINPMRIPINQKESIRWLENLEATTSLFNNDKRCVHVGDRESDIYELLCLANQVNTNFLIRSCHDRIIDGEHHKTRAKMDSLSIAGTHTIRLENSKDKKDRDVKLNIKFQRLNFLVPIDKKKNCNDITVTIIDAKEEGCPKNEEPIFWRLITNLEVNSLDEAIEKINWYQQRWKIEVFHKILKSGLKAESLRFRDAKSLTNTISIFCILACRIFWMTMINRIAPNAPPELTLTKDEIKILNIMCNKNPTKYKNTISEYITKIAMLGGYLARSSDPPPGNIVIWRGMQKLRDMLFGFQLVKN